MRQRMLCAALLALVTPAFGQGIEFGQLISGKEIPLSVKLKDLNGDWRRMAVGGKEGAKGPDLMSMLGPLMQLGMASDAAKGKGGGKGQDDASSAAMGMMVLNSLFGGGANAGEPAYYTKGQTVNMSGEVFIVAYRAPKQPAMNLMALLAAAGNGKGEMPDLTKMGSEKLTGETALSLVLLNLKTVASISDIRPFDLDKEIAESEGAGSDLLSGLLGAAGKGAPAKKETPSEGNLRQIATALEIYLQNKEEVLPPMNDAPTAKKALLPYVKDESIFLQPDTKEPYQVNPILSRHKVGHITNPDEMIVFYEAKPAADGTRAAAFLDGHVERVSAEDWPRLKKASKLP